MLPKDRARGDANGKFQINAHLCYAVCWKREKHEEAYCTRLDDDHSRDDYATHIIDPLTGFLIVLIGIIVSVWKSTTKAKTAMVVSTPLEKVCETIPQVMTHKGWTMTMSEAGRGHFESKQGISLQSWGQIMVIDATKLNEGSTTVRLQCQSRNPYQKFDAGKSRSDVEKISEDLEQALGAAV